eukprot:scaffold1052_cov225-Ochromonas_danica.AAC.2
MSNFYRKYILGSKKDSSSSKSANGNTEAKNPVVDPTAMAPAQQPRRVSTKVTKDPNAPSPAANPHSNNRRVQIFNSSDAFSPDEKRQLP